ncbi:MAG: corrinoid protein [Candidatus Bathyarchaeota archaeon]|nr:corrinoid protein [Candidatus Bathyarchaeota archaeon]MDH5713647.1 corrinoid protein [Candidatus Bathyarchaeota archaeon]
MSEEKIIDGLRKAVVDYDEESAKRLANEVIEKGIDPLKAIQEGLVKGINEVGEKFGAKKIFLSELMIAAEACLVGMDLLKPQIPLAKNAKPVGKVVIGTVYGDIHFIGKRLVAMMLEANGFDVYDIGEDQPAEAFVDKAKEVGADIVGASALTTTTRLEQEKLVKAFRKSGLKAKIMIGGAVVDAAWAETVGADGYAKNLQDAVTLAKQLMERTREKVI